MKTYSMLCHFPTRPNQLAACDDLTEKSIYFTLIYRHVLFCKPKALVVFLVQNVFPNKLFELHYFKSQIQPACVPDHIKKTCGKILFMVCIPVCRFL